MPGETLSAARLGFGRAAVEELARRREEPEWLRAIRRRAFDAFESLPVPDQRTEGWRRTSLRGLDLDSVEPLAMDDDSTSAVEPGEIPAAAGDARVVAFRNGRPRSSDALTDVRVVDLQTALREPGLAARIEQHFAQVVAPETDRFTAMHYAFFNAGVVVFVPRGTATRAPVWISHEFDHVGQAALVHTLIVAEDGAEVRIVEDFQGGSGFASGVVEQVIGANAHVRYVHLQRWAADVWNFSTQRAHLAQDASLRTLNVAVGRRMTRNSIQVVLDGRGAEADLLGVVDGRERQHVDFQTLQEHSGNATRSDLVIHDALRDRSSANFTGLIRINKSAHQTASSQEQKNILLSEQARADSDPKLEILNNDVIRCTHGASVGPVDPESIFYLGSRGLDRPTAERLIIEGFFQSVLRKVDMPSMEEAVWGAIDAHAGTIDQ